MNKKIIQSYIEISPLYYNSVDLIRDMISFVIKNPFLDIGYKEVDFQNVDFDISNELIHPDDLERVKLQLERIRRSELGANIYASYRVRHKEGNYVWINSRYKVTELGKDGMASKAIGVVEDISRLKEIEVELKSAIAQLEKISFRDYHELRGL